MINRSQKVQHILNQLNLEFDYIHYLKTHNKGQNNPYHNNEHCFTMAINCFEAANLYCLSPTETREIAISALFHDFDHSGGKTTDHENILRAISGVETLFTHNMVDKALFKSNSLKNICNNISCTEYPFVHTPITLSQKIIRDADLMQYLDDDKLVFMNGLSQELNFNITWDITINFLQQQELFTEWGKNKLTPIFNSTPKNKIKF